MARMPHAANAIALPFTILCDDREKAPYYFSGYSANSRHKYRPLVVPLKTQRLRTGDYSIEGLTHLVAAERKSLEDLYGTLAADDRRLRFEGEHERMDRMNAAGGVGFVVIEASLQTAMYEPPSHSKLSPESVFGTFTAWATKFHVPWYWCGDRATAEVTTLRLLEKFWHRFHRHHSQEGAKHGPQENVSAGSGRRAAESRSAGPASLY